MDPDFYTDLPVNQHLDQQQIPTLNQLYYDPAEPGSFSSAKKLFHAARRRGLKVSLKDVQQFLENQNTYSRHRPLKKRFVRRPTVTSGPNVQWQMDIIVLPRKWTAGAGGYNMVLTAIDIFSKKTYARALKTKGGVEVTAALNDILGSIPEVNVPKKIQTDKGREFLNRNVRGLLAQHNIEMFTTEQEDMKASLIERFNRTLRQYIHRYDFAMKQGDGPVPQWHEVLPKLVDSYNSTLHSALDMTPNEVEDSNAHIIRDKLYEGTGRYAPHFVKAYQLDRKKMKLPKFKAGDLVRLSMQENIFTRGFTPNYSGEIFTVHKVNTDTYPFTYVLKDQGDKKGGVEIIKGEAYEAQLQKVTSIPDVLKVQILETDLKGKRVKVHWVDWPDIYDRWISMDDLVEEGEEPASNANDVDPQTQTQTQT